MEFMTLTNSQQMSMLGLGTSGMRGEECTRAVRSALEIGYTHIDTAEMYDNEEAIGAAIAGVDREKLFITSKVWRERPLNYDDVMKSCQASLNRLGVEYLDLYLIHWPNRKTNYRDVFEALCSLQGDELINALGVSNFTISHMPNAIKICDEIGVKIAVNQVEFHVGLYQRELHELCDEHDIALTAYRPICKGKLVGGSLLDEIGSRYSKSATQVALRWLIQKGIAAIPKSSNHARQQSNISIFDFELIPSEMAQLDALGCEHRLVKPSWAEFEVWVS